MCSLPLYVAPYSSRGVADLLSGQSICDQSRPCSEDQGRDSSCRMIRESCTTSMIHTGTASQRYKEHYMDEYSIWNDPTTQQSLGSFEEIGAGMLMPLPAARCARFARRQIPLSSRASDLFLQLLSKECSSAYQTTLPMKSLQTHATVSTASREGEKRDDRRWRTYLTGSNTNFVA